MSVAAISALLAGFVGRLANAPGPDDPGGWSCSHFNQPRRLFRLAEAPSRGQSLQSVRETVANVISVAITVMTDRCQ